MAPRLRQRGWLSLFALVVVLLWLSFRPQTDLRTAPLRGFQRDFNVHPIDELLARGERQWNEMLERQSKTLEEAVNEYKRRYRRNPPKGFDHWYNWAVEKGLKLVDEFDTIHENLLPFWGLSPVQIEARRVEMFDMAESDRLFTVEIRDGELYDDPDALASTTRWPINKSYLRMMQGISQWLPDMNITINLHDVPLIHIPYEERERLIALGKERRFLSDQEHLEAAHHQYKDSDRAMNDLRRSCPPGSPIFDTATDAFGEPIPGVSWSQSALDFRLPPDLGGFIHDQKVRMDVCRNPELQDQHGNFLRCALPELHFKRNYLYPLFSWTRYPRSADILIPTSYRFENQRPWPKPWEELEPKITWRGTFTGMDSLDSANSWASQRLRLMNLVKSSIDDVQVYVGSNGTGFDVETVNVGPLNKAWMDVEVSGNTKDMWQSRVKDIVNAKFKFFGWLDNKDRNKAKFLLDIDGWGWSARFRELLWSNSAVLKATIFEEVTSAWLVPWYHYIPIDYAYRDLYSILLYFLGLDGTDQLPRDEAAKLVGQHSKEWVMEHGMWDQHKAYMYRLLLEWARINSDRGPECDYDG